MFGVCYTASIIMNRSLLIILLLCLFPATSHALLPPDVILNVGMQLAYLVGSIVALATFGISSVWLYVRGWYSQKKTYIFGGLLILILVGLSGGTYVAYKHLNERVQITSFPDAGEDVTSTDRLLYYSDSFTVYVPDLLGGSVLEIDFNRQETSQDTFSHQYYVLGTLGSQSLFENTSLVAADDHVDPSGWVQSYEHIEAVDFSLRDTFKIVGELAGDEYIFEFSDFQGDFITRGRLDYLRQASAFKGTVAYQGITYPAFVYHEHTAAVELGADLVFFDSSALSIQSGQFMLWDEGGNFYLIDQTTVEPKHPSYTSHTWLLHKDNQSGAVFKGYDAVIEVNGREAFVIETESFGRVRFDLQLETDYASSDQVTRGSVTGTVTDAISTRAIVGSVYFDITPR